LYLAGIITGKPVLLEAIMARRRAKQDSNDERSGDASYGDAQGFERRRNLSPK